MHTTKLTSLTLNTLRSITNDMIYHPYIINEKALYYIFLKEWSERRNKHLKIDNWFQKNHERQDQIFHIPFCSDERQKKIIPQPSQIKTSTQHFAPLTWSEAQGHPRNGAPKSARWQDPCRAADGVFRVKHLENDRCQENSQEVAPLAKWRKLNLLSSFCRFPSNCVPIFCWLITYHHRKAVIRPLLFWTFKVINRPSR